MVPPAICAYQNKFLGKQQAGHGVCKLITLFDDISTIIHQHDLYGQLCDGIIGEEDKEFANKKKDEINAKKRESVMFVDK